MASLSVHESLDAPFSTATAASVDDPGYPVSVDGRPYLLDLNSDQFSRRSVQLLNTQQAQSGGDVALLTPMVWRRSTDRGTRAPGRLATTGRSPCRTASTSPTASTLEPVRVQPAARHDPDP